MDIGVALSWLLGFAVLMPLGSFALILLFGPHMGKGGKQAGACATGAILVSCVLSMISLGIWLSNHPPIGDHGSEHAAQHDEAVSTDGETNAADSDSHDSDSHDSDSHDSDSHDSDPVHTDGETNEAVGTDGETNAADGGNHDEHGHDEHGHDEHGHDEHGHAVAPPHYSYEVYTLGDFGLGHRMSISVYIDTLTVCMFCMVTLIATCIHFYATGYMHDELEGPDYVDHEVTMDDGSHLHRPGRFHRFFQALSLFCFSMLGLVLSGNIAMTFVFWELVGICSYFLIGFYVERHSASTAANKAFIVNRVGDFGMIIGLMALWGSLGTFSFGGSDGIFEQVRSSENDYALVVPDGMVRASAQKEVAAVVEAMGPSATAEQISKAVDAKIPEWRDAEKSGVAGGYGRWLLIVAGVGIFCGCIGKSAQFPLHVWLPDAMEGPTPVSALVHSATMVAAGVFLVARFYPVFTPEVLFVIALVGAVTLFMAATIAITATDIKRVLAYSTVSQLGYMMLALGLGGWLAGVMHLFTHAFFKSLLFMCSGSVIHAVHTNEMTEMGGLRKKMPWTAYTMLIGCMAIAGAGIPFAIVLFGESYGFGFSGFYSKDAILEQALSFRNTNPGWGNVFFLAAAGGAAITAFYMFRLWYLTFAGQPRDQHRYDHAHESPPVMYRPLILLSVFAIGVAWGPVQGIVCGSVAAIFFFALYIRRYAKRQHEDHHLPSDALVTSLIISGAVVVIGMVLSMSGNNDITLGNLLEQARPAGTLPTEEAALLSMTWPNEHDSHVDAIRVPATWIAFATAFGGFFLATMFYGLRKLDAAESQKTFAPIHRFLLNKWWFDELYNCLFIRPCHIVSGWISSFDRTWIDGFIEWLAWATRTFARFWERIADRTIVDGFVNGLAALTYRCGASLRRVQTGNLRQYVMFIVVGTVVVFVLASFWRFALAQ